MKKLLFITGFTLLTTSSNGQVLISLLFGDKLNTPKIEFGLVGGLTRATIAGQENAKFTSLFNLGFYFDFKLKNPAWMVHTGVLVKSDMGTEGIPLYSLGNSDLDSAFAGGNITRKISYFNVPVFMKYEFKNRLFVFTGPQLGLRTKATDIFRNSLQKDNDLTYKTDIKDQFTRLDAGFAGGIGYHLKGSMSIFIHYYQGLVDIQTTKTGGQYNSVLYLSACIPVGGIKEPPKPEK